jgi:hypothetical protein
MMHSDDGCRDENESSVWSDSLERQRALSYRQAIVDAITTDQWRQIVARACDEALEGDGRARDWVLKLLAVVVKSSGADDERVDPVSHSQLLESVTAARTTTTAESRCQRHDDERSNESAHELTSDRHGPSASWLAPGYRQAILDVVTPDKWQRIVANARYEALAGDHRAREWVLKLLGSDDGLEDHAEIDDSHMAVRLHSLAQEQKGLRIADRK